jgi:hypothetical protein
MGVNPTLYQLALKVTLDRHTTVMVGEGRPSTSFRAAIGEDVDGGPSPAMTRKAWPKSQRHRGLVLFLSPPFGAEREFCLHPVLPQPRAKLMHAFIERPPLPFLKGDRHGVRHIALKQRLDL